MSAPAPAPLTTPSRPPVDAAVLEAQKENVVPLASGRSASQLASLSSQSRSGLGLKLASEHRKFQTQLAAVAFFEAEGHWPDGQDGLAASDVAAMAEDPLDVHHQYARFVIGSYPAGASATSRLVPLLEASTRQFLNDERYKNDPRYLRLWNLYAQKMDCPEDCYRFLFAKNVGERLASLYEEYALVLEAAGKRQQAEQIYQLGIHRAAAPLDRLKKAANKFRERMLVAPPLPDPAPTPAASSSSSSRSILAGAGVQGLGAGAVKENGAKLFEVFADAGGEAGEKREGAVWEDLGTVKSRKRENEVEGSIWKGQTLPVTPGGVNGKPAPFKLEVFRDAPAAPSAPTTPSASTDNDLFRSSVAATAEADALRQNPFKNYSQADSSLSAIDPLKSIPPVPAKSKSSSSSTKRTKSSSSSSSSKPKEGEKAAEFRTCDLNAVYPSPGVEYSFEELKLRRRVEYSEVAESWNGWEWYGQWKEEVKRTGRTGYVIDPATSWPKLYDDATGAPLWDFLPRPKAPSPEPVAEVPEPAPASPTSPLRASQPEHSLMSPSPVRAAPATVAQSPVPAPPAELAAAEPTTPPRSPSPGPREDPIVDEHDSVQPLQDSPVRPSSQAHPDYVDPRRVPSPTINTLKAQELVDNMFAKTLDFGSFANDGFPAEDDEDEPETDDEENDRPAWADLPPSQLDIQSQMTQEPSGMGLPPTQDDPPFVPFSQTASQLDDSLFASQLSQVDEVTEEPTATREPAQVAPLGMGLAGGVDDDENAGVVQPMRLFRDAPAASTSAPQATPGGFRPTLRTPLGAKPLGGFKPVVTATPAAAPFAIFSDKPAPAPAPLAERDEHEFEADSSFEAPIQERSMGDGFDMGRRERGIPTKYAGFIDNMTPITERTLEFGSATRNLTTSSLAASQRSRRESQFSQPAVVQEEDEDDETSSSEDGGDRAFVASEVAFEGVNEDDSSNSDDSDDSEEPSTDDEPEPMQLPVSAQMQPPRLEVEAQVARLSIGEHSFDRSGATGLSEGYTITGNQSGMNTNMHLASTAELLLASPAAAADSAAIDPFSPALLARLVEAAAPPVFDHADAHDRRHLVSDQLAGLQKTAKKREAAAKSGKAAKDRTGVLDDVWELELDGQLFSVREKLGEGAFGAVFRVSAPGGGDGDDSIDLDADEDEDENAGQSAVKVEQPTNLWEWHVIRQLHARLDERSRRSIVDAKALYAYQDASYLLLDICDQGSLLDAVNKANDAGTAPPTAGASTGLEEVLAVFFTVELLRTIEAFHRAGFVHGDLKMDNCLLRFEDVPGGARGWSAQYDRAGAGGWACKGLKVIDFGRTIDRTAFPAGQRFRSTFEADHNDCPEMRSNQVWTDEPDYYGLATIAFTLLFGRYLETKQVDGRWVISQNFRRYQQAEMWGRLFDTLLNPGMQPEQGADRLRVRREEMEGWLEANGEKAGKSLKGLVRKMEMWAMAGGK